MAQVRTLVREGVLEKLTAYDADLLLHRHLAALLRMVSARSETAISSGESISHPGMTIDAASELLDGCVMERWTRPRQFLNRDSACPAANNPMSFVH